MPHGLSGVQVRTRGTCDRPRRCAVPTLTAVNPLRGRQPPVEGAVQDAKWATGVGVGGQNLNAWLAEAGGLGTGAARRTASRAGLAVGVIQAA